MLGTLIDWLENLFWKITCKQDDYKSLFAICLLVHLKKQHNIKPTKRDLKFLLHYNFITRLIKFLIACVLIIPVFILKVLCWVFEIIDSFL